MLLLLVLVAVAMLSLSAYHFTDMMMAERQAAQVHGRQIQAQALADSGVSAARAFLLQTPADQEAAGGTYSNTNLFQGRVVLDDGTPAGRGRFTLVASNLDSSGVPSGVRYGMENESTRLNLNTLLVADQVQEGSGRTLLKSLPGMTDETADAILDWLDPDEEAREFGCEADYYASQQPPYRPKNGPLETVEELLLIRGVTPNLLFGPDHNRNGMIDSTEMQSGVVDGVDNSDGSMNGGWARYLTLHSIEMNMTPDAQPKINLNGDDLTVLDQELRAKFPGEWASFIVAYRLSGAYTGTNAAAPAQDGQIDLTKKPSKKLTSVLDLVGAKVQVTFQGQRTAVVMDSPFPNVPLGMDAFMPALMDYTAVNASTVIPGRINVNQAPKAILLGIPTMTPELAEQIISQRTPSPTGDQPGRRHETWLLTEGLVTLDQMKQIFPFVTGGGNAYRVQAVGYFEDRGPAARIEAVLQSGAGEARLVYWRDLSHLGRGFPLELLGVAGASQNSF